MNSVFIAGFHNEIPIGTLLRVSDQPIVPEGVKTTASDKKVTTEYAHLHLRIGSIPCASSSTRG